MINRIADLDYRFIYRRHVFNKTLNHNRIVFHFFTYGGLGDRLIFKSILSMQLSDNATYTICGIPFHGDDYDARSYPLKSDELWIIPEPYPKAYRKPYPVAHDILRECEALYGHDNIIIYLYGNKYEEQTDPRVIPIDPYQFLTKSYEDKKCLTDFASDAPFNRVIGNEFIQLFLDKGVDSIVAFHIPFSNHPKYPNSDLLVRLACMLKMQLNSYNILIGQISGIRVQEQRCFDFVVPNDNSLQILAAMFPRISLYVGGDSGPTHMAGVTCQKIINIRPHSCNWIHGPFTNEDKLTVIQGYNQSQNKQAFEFDVDRTFEVAKAILKTAQPDLTSLPSPEAAHFRYSDLIYICDFLDAHQYSLSYFGAQSPMDLEAAVYLSARNFQVDFYSDSISLCTRALEVLTNSDNATNKIVFQPTGVLSDEVHRQIAAIKNKHFFVLLTPDVDVVKFIDNIKKFEGELINIIIKSRVQFIERKADKMDKIVRLHEKVLSTLYRDAVSKVYFLDGIPVCTESSHSYLAELVLKTADRPYLFQGDSIYVDSDMGVFPDAGKMFNHDSLFMFDSPKELFDYYFTDTYNSCPYDSFDQCMSSHRQACTRGHAYATMSASRKHFIRINRKIDL